MADIDNPYDKVVDNLFNQNTTPQEPGAGPDLIAQKSAYSNGLPPGSVVTKGLPDDMPAPDPANDVTAPTGATDAPLRAAVMDGMQYNPEQAAKALPIAKDAQLPLDMTLRNLPDLQKQADFNNIDFKTLNTDYPKLAQFFHNPDNAAVAHDDIGALQKVGDWAKSIVMDHYDVGAIRDTLGEYGQNFISSAIHGAGESYYGFFQGLENAGEGLDTYMQKEHPGMDALDVFLLKSASVAAHDIGMVGGKTGEDVAQFGTDIDNQKDGLLPGMTRMAGGIGGAMANPAGLVPGFMAQFAGQSYQEAKKDGFDVNSTRANTAAMLSAGVAWLTGKLGPEVIAKGLPEALQAKVTTGIAGMMAKHGIDPGGTAAQMAYRAADASMRAVADAVAMTGQTIAGNAINQNVLDEKGSLTQGMSDALQQGGILGVIAGLIFHHANENFHPAMNEYRTQMMDAGRQVVAESKLQGRAPEKMNQYLRAELGDRDIYVNPGAARVFYQGLGDDERASLDKSMPEFAKQLGESMKTGEDIQIDQADYHTYMQQLEGSKNLDQWVKWIPEGTSEGDEKVHESFIKSLYEGLDGAKEKEDPVSENIYRQLIQRYGERTAVSGSPHIARLLSQNPADFFRTMLNREGDTPEVRAILERFIQRLQFARQYPSLEIEMRKGGDALDLLIDKIRNDKASAADKLKTADERAATFEQNAKEGKKTKAYRPRGAKTSTPVMDYLRGLGGIRPDSSAGKALEKIAPKAKYRSLYDEEGLRGIDNLDVKGFNDYGHDYGLNFEGLKTHEGDENPHYLNPEDIYREVEREVNGKGAKNTEDAAHDAAAEDILHVMDVMGFDFDKASNQQIKNTLDVYSKQWTPDASEGQRLYQGEKNLVAVHNLSEAKLAHADKMGGIAAPVKDKHFFQGGGEKPRGSITFPVDGSPLIHLFEGENLSTILHEYGHLYWHTLDALSKLEGATEQVRADVNAVREWAGAEGSDPLTTEQEEKIADGFLRYLKDHEAPSQEVMTSFQHFKSWLSNIYGGVKDALLPKINPHVKDVFDRMFATDDEIQRMKDHPEYAMDPRLAGFLTDAQKATAQRKHDRMVAEAKEKLFRKAMRQSEEKGTDEYKAARSQVEAETEQRVAAETRYQALAAAHTSGLDRKKSLAAYGKYGKEAMEYLKQHRGLFKKGGVDPEVLAGLHGFNSARDMLDTFQKMEPRKEYAARLTDETMTARHGDMLKDGSIEREAVQAFHNGMRAQVLEWEMKQAAALGKIAAPSGQGIELKARQILGARKMSEIVPSRFYRSEIAAAKRYGEALGKKDFEGAAVAKAQQLLNHHLYEKALAARDFRDKMLTKWTKKLLKPDEKLAKTMDMDFVYAARSILAAHGIGSGKFDYEAWYQHLTMDDPETANTMREVIENAGLANAKPIKDMTYAEFQGLADNIQALIHIGTDSKTITIQGQRYDRKMLVQELTDMAANSGGSGLASGMGGKVPDKDLNKKGILGLSGYIRRSENMLTKLDQYRMDGPFRKVIWSPVKEAVEKYRDARDEVLKKTLSIIEPERDRLLGEKITAAELVSENTGESYTFENKAELVGMMQHLGNGFEPGSNGYKLLRGYGWKPEQLTAFLNRAHLSGLITKADWDLVQKIWDMYGSQKDAIWKAHREMRGFYPSDIDSVPVKTPFGEYAGGYAPAIVDRTKSTAIDDKELKNQITNEDNNFAFPSTGRGATMQRVAHSAYPLEMNLMTLPKHMDWAMKFIHIEPVVKQIAKVLFDKNFKEAMDQVNPAMVGEVLVPWLQRTARQSMNMSRDKANPIVQKVTGYLRRNNQLQALGFNPIYMVQRIGSLGPMIQTTGGVHTLAAIGDLLQNRGELRQQIKEESAFMRHRNNTVDENVQLKMQRVLQERSGREKVRDWAVDHGYIIQHLTHGFLDDLQYLAAKYQAQAGEVDGVDPDKPEQVQAHAEKAVRYTQGSFHPEDASRVEASGSWFNKLGTVFYGIMNSQGNMLWDQGHRIAQSNKSGFSKGMSGLYLFAMGYSVPALVAAGVSAAIKGGTPANQTPEKFWLETLLGSQLSYGMGMLPWVRDLANPIINKLEDRHYDDQVALGGSLLDFLNKVFVDTPGDLKDYLLNSGSGKKVLNDLLSDFGYAAQVPVTPLRRAMNYGIAVHQGTDTANNPGQIVRGIIGGPHPKE